MNTETTYQGPAIDDPDILEYVPPELRELLAETNGFVRWSGGLHLRGACRKPQWHSLREAMFGPMALHALYPDVLDPTDVPFAQDCSGDQFVLRGGEVHQLAAEVGEIDPLGIDLRGFLAQIEADPVEALCMHPLLRYLRDGGVLQPGRLLLAYPPFCTGQSGAGASLRDVPALEVIRFHADLARRINDLGGGEEFVFRANE